MTTEADLGKCWHGRPLNGTCVLCQVRNLNDAKLIGLAGVLMDELNRRWPGKQVDIPYTRTKEPHP